MVSSGIRVEPPEEGLRIEKSRSIGFGITMPRGDMHSVGVVRRIEEATYDYADIRDDKHNSMLTIPLLQFEGKCVEIIVNIINEHNQGIQPTANAMSLK